MRTLVLVGLIATTAWADAPDSVAGKIYDETAHDLGSSHNYVTVASLRANGTYSTILREHYFWLSDFSEHITRTVDGADAGTFSYVKTGKRTATLTFTSTSGHGVVTRNLEFDGSGTGLFRYEPSGSGRFYVSAVADAPIMNASARGTASVNKPLIVGFIIPEPRPRYVLLRAVGPGLAQFGVPNTADDTTFEIFGKRSTPRGWPVTGFGNDDWESDAHHELGPGMTTPATSVGAFIGAFPLDEGSKDSALVLRFSPGAYTMVIRTKSETPAEVLGEVYIVP